MHIPNAIGLQGGILGSEAGLRDKRWLRDRMLPGTPLSGGQQVLERGNLDLIVSEAGQPVQETNRPAYIGHFFVTGLQE